MSADDTPKPRLVLFAKTPLAGRVKTRLQPPLSAQQAADLASIMTVQTLTNAMRHWRGDTELHTWPDAGHPLFRELSRRFAIKVRRQSGGDLGDRMFQSLAHAGRVCAVMGTDVPHCPGEVLRVACDALAAGRDVLGPSADGGYYFIGLHRPLRALFSDIPWGTDSVLSATRARAAQHGIDLFELPVLKDVDTWSDLAAVRSQVPSIDDWLDGLCPGTPADPVTASRRGSQDI